MQAERWQIEEAKPADPHNGYLLRVVPMGEYDAEAMEAPEVGEVLVREGGSLSLADVRARLKEQESEYRREADGTPPGPPSPPITPGAQGWPTRDELRAMVATLGVFEWCEANGLLEDWSGELRRARDAFMFAHGDTAKRWREQTDEEPSWSQYAYLIRDNERLRDEVTRLEAALKEALGEGAQDGD